MLSPLLLVTFSLVGVTPETHPQQPGAQTHPAWLQELNSHPQAADELLHLPLCSNGILQAPLPPLVPQAWQAHQDARFRHDPSHFEYLSDEYRQAPTPQRGQKERRQTTVPSRQRDEHSQTTSTQRGQDAHTPAMIPSPLDDYSLAVRSQPGQDAHTQATIPSPLHGYSQAVRAQSGQDEYQQATITAPRHDSNAETSHSPPPLTQPPSGHAFDPAGTMRRTHYPASLPQDANLVLRATCLARFRPWPRASPR